MILDPGVVLATVEVSDLILAQRSNVLHIWTNIQDVKVLVCAQMLINLVQYLG